MSFFSSRIHFRGDFKFYKLMYFLDVCLAEVELEATRDPDIPILGSGDFGSGDYHRIFGEIFF